MSGSARPHGGGLETRVAELERKGREADVAALEGRVTTAEGDITALEGRATALESRTANGVIAGFGSFSLNTGAATSTVVAKAGVAASSLIFLSPSNANGWSIDAGISGIAPASGSFTVSHTASSLTRSFNYIVINPTP